MTLHTESLHSQDRYDEIAEAISAQGYCVLSEFIPAEITASLQQRVLSLSDADLKPAGIGRDQDFHIAGSIRSDTTHWLSPDHPIDKAYLDEMAHLRLAMNQRLYLGLFDYECHYAHYAPGAFYKKHLDAFKGKSSRLLTTVMYFNLDWEAQDGGEMLIYSPDSQNILATVKPELGTFVIFLSDQFPHEVLNTHRDRYSIAGWFRIPDPFKAPLL